MALEERVLKDQHEEYLQLCGIKSKTQFPKRNFSKASRKDSTRNKGAKSTNNTNNKNSSPNKNNKPCYKAYKRKKQIQKEQASILFQYYQ